MPLPSALLDGPAAEPLLLLLLAGHLLGDFLFAPRWRLAPGTCTTRGLVRHGLVMLVLQSAVVLWVTPIPRAVGLLLVLALFHVGIDATRAGFERGWPARRLTWLVIDQLAHLVVLLVVWWLWPRESEVRRITLLAVARISLAAGILAFNVHGASALVSSLLHSLRPAGSVEPVEGAGRMIGILERLMILGLVSLGQWSAVGLVLTAKSVARFKRLEQQEFAETYLVGTMASVMCAMVSGWLLSALL